MSACQHVGIRRHLDCVPALFLTVCAHVHSSLELENLRTNSLCLCGAAHREQYRKKEHPIWMLL